MSAISLEHLAKPFHLIQEPFACSLAVLRVEVVFFIGPLLEVVAHHDCVFKQKEVRAPAKLLNLCQRTRWGSRCSYWNQLWKIYLVL